MSDIRFTGTYMLDSVYGAVFNSTGRSEYFNMGDVSLKDILGENAEVKIYLETPIQDVEVPYITIRQLDADKKQDNYRHHWRRALFDIEYIPDDTETSKNRELLEVSEILVTHLTDIETPNGAKLQARSLKAEIIDGVLHIFADYQQLTEDALPDDPIMETLDHDIYVKDN